MLAATHAVAGGILATALVSPQVAILAAVISHPLLDLFPHWDLGTRKDIKRTKNQLIGLSLLDAFVGFALGIILFHQFVPIPILLLTMFAAQIFDWAEAPYKVFDWKFPPFSTIKYFQHMCHNKLRWPWGFLPQVGILIFAVYFAWALR